MILFLAVLYFIEVQVTYGFNILPTTPVEILAEGLVFILLAMSYLQRSKP